jgi:dTDP-4-amino-4,6-dideoxygalactose transaminase
MSIGFNKPYLTGKETQYIEESVRSGKISGDGEFTKKCHAFFEDRYRFKKALLTTSCTDALEMAAILVNIQPGDEVIAPAFTFVSTVNAFVLRGAKIRFIDCLSDYPNMDVDQIAPLVSEKTKAIIPVHYAGVACDMDPLMKLASDNNIHVVEDAAQAIDSYYKGIPLGSIGDLAAFSFHETKNVIAGEGGMLVINNEEFLRRAEIIREKGTNRSAFFRGEIDKYGWVDIGSSFLPSDIIAAFLYAQLENLDDIQKRRAAIWTKYYEGLAPLEKAGKLKLPVIPSYATNNAHMFFVLTKDLKERTALLEHLKTRKINAVFHYLSLHKSPFFSSMYHGPELLHSDRFSDTLLRLPFFYELTAEQQDQVIDSIIEFYI